MRKLIYLLAIILFSACQAEEKPQEELNFENCAEISEAHLTVAMEEANEGLWPNATINIVLSPEFAEIDLKDGINYDAEFKNIASDFTDITGVKVEFYAEENAPDNYVYYQHAFWNGSSIGTKGGRAYASTNTLTIRENPETILHFLAHIAGSQTGDINEVDVLYK